MNKKLHLLKVFKHAFGRINSTKVFGLFLLSLSIPAFSQVQKLDSNFENLLKEKSNIAKGKKIGKLSNNVTIVESQTLVTKDEIKTVYPAIVYTDNPSSLKDKGILVQSIVNNFATTLLTIEDIERLNNDPSIIAIQAPYEDSPTNAVSIEQSGASLLHRGFVNNTVYKGENVLVGIFDTGIDWKHPDFRDPNDPSKSRIVSIWDQTINPINGESSPNGFNYGVEYTKAHIEDELDGTPTNFVRENDINGHGTHVAGTVAGNGAGLPDRKHQGFAPNAELVVVKGGNSTFPSTNTINSLTYFKAVASALNKPIVVNYSIGGQGTAKDGTASHELAMDDFSNSGPGRVVVVAAGNDWGGNFHKKETVEPGSEVTFEVEVSSNITNNTGIADFYIYSENGNNLVGTLTDPNGLEVEFPISATTTHQVLNDTFEVKGYNWLSPSNMKRYIQFVFKRLDGTQGSTNGKYIFKVKNNDTTSSTIHGYRMSPATGLTATLTGGDNEYIVSSPGNSTEAITVANYFGRNLWHNNLNNSNYSISQTQGPEGIANTSNQGPRIDGVLKPDIAASGSVVISSKSAGQVIGTTSALYPYMSDNQYYMGKTGTSMASPGVAGATALLLQAKPTLTSKEVKELLTNSALKDVATGASANSRWGHGKLDIYKAVSTAVLPTKSEFETLLYDDKIVERKFFEATGMVLGTILTPTKTGKLGSVSFLTRHNSTYKNDDTPLTIEIRKVTGNNIVGEVIGQKIIQNPVTSLQFGSWSSVDISDLNIQTTYGEEFAVILKPSGKFYLYFEDAKPDNKSVSLQNEQFARYNNRDLSIRTTLYEDLPAVKNLALSNISSTFEIDEPKNYAIANNQFLGKIEKHENHNITGTVDAKVWITNSTKHVNRVYQYTPQNNSDNTSARVTLYYTQNDFDQFNQNNNVKLPTSPTDETGKANLLVYKFKGSSNDNTGELNSYTEGYTTITPTPTDILWNPTYSYWEVSFETTGFSGFFVGNDSSTLSTATVANNNDVKVYPNPVKDDLNIIAPTGKNIKEIKLFDTSGKVVLHQNKLSQNPINVSQLPKGLYIVEVILNNDTKVTKKIIKE